MKEFICYNYLFREVKPLKFKYQKKVPLNANNGLDMAAAEAIEMAAAEAIEMSPDKVQTIEEESCAFELRQELLTNALFRGFPDQNIYKGDIELGSGKSTYKAKIVGTREMFVLTIDKNDNGKYKYDKQIVIIDNSIDVQRIFVEKQNQTLRDIKKMEKMLQSFLTNSVKEWGLAVDLYQLHNVDDFWELVRFGEKYEDGVVKINYSLPALNLERLKSGYLQTMNLIRKTYKGKMSFSIEATKGRTIEINDKDEFQRNLNKLMMEGVGGNCITINFKSNPDKEFNPCEKSFSYIKLDNKYFVSETSILYNEEFKNKIKELNDCLLDCND